jgi:hypothetical protein
MEATLSFLRVPPRWPAAGSEKRLMLEYAGLEKV